MEEAVSNLAINAITIGALIGLMAGCGALALRLLKADEGTHAKGISDVQVQRPAAAGSEGAGEGGAPLRRRGTRPAGAPGTAPVAPAGAGEAAASAEGRRARSWLADQWSAEFWPADKRRWWQRLKNVSRAGKPPRPAAMAHRPPAVASGKVAAADPPGPGHHHAHGAGQVPDHRPASFGGATGPVRFSEACEPCAVFGCKQGCNCACHWGEVHARADAWYGAPEFDAGLIARADAVLAGAL